MQPTKFVVRRFENRNGNISWRVSGWLAGIRIRRNFKTQEEAAVEKASLEIKAAQIATGFRPVATTLTEAQLREAEAMFRQLAGLTHTLSSCVDFTLMNYRAPQARKTLADAISDYISTKQREFDEDQLSGVQLERIRRDLRNFDRHFPEMAVSQLTPPALVSYLDRGVPALKTFNNRRGIISTFFKYAFQRGWIGENPIHRVPLHRIRRRRSVAQTLTADQARKLMHEIERFENGRWVPYFALCLFAGIRPSVPDGEIARLRPEAVCLKTGVISISAEVSKVRESRKVVIQPNLAAWLRAYPLEKFPIIVTNFFERRSALSKRFGLTHDVLRHTFISMFVAKFRSLGEAALQAGNSEGIIRKHYLDLKSAAEADDFFGILPKRLRSRSTVSFPTPPVGPFQVAV